MYTPAGVESRSAVIVLGGSEGGLSEGTAQLLAEQGFVTLALAYFGAPGLPNELSNIPLEYFDSAISWLKLQPGVDAKRIGALGFSKGGEAVLLVASRNPSVRAVVAGVPANVSWQGIGKASAPGGAASWSLRGKSVPFLPYDYSKPFSTPLDLYVRSFAKRSAHPDAVIPVEKINGPILLVCGAADNLWPSCPMSDEAIAHLKEKKFPSRVQLLRYPDAGHGAFGPPLASGTPGVQAAFVHKVDADAAARADGWPKVIAFLSEALNQKR
jgi:dienelactone hydrolase